MGGKKANKVVYQPPTYDLLRIHKEIILGAPGGAVRLENLEKSHASLYDVLSHF